MTAVYLLLLAIGAGLIYSVVVGQNPLTELKAALSGSAALPKAAA